MARFICSRTEDGHPIFDFRNKLTPEEVEERKQALKEEIKERQSYLPEYIRNNPGESDQAKAELRQMIRESKRLRPGMRKVEGVAAIYLPVRLIGPSPLSGLTPTQVNLLVALTMELTRAGRKTGRPDEAQVIRRGPSDPGRQERTVPVCPFLDKGKEYVVFGGNGKGTKSWLHGYGFKLHTWRRKAGYPASSEYGATQKDLCRLADPFGLVVAAWNKQTREWKTLEDMRAMGRTKHGRKWLDGCVVRVYTEADYLTRWRRYFAERLGFSWIPGGGEEDTAQPVSSRAGQEAAIRSAHDLGVWMRAQGLTDGQLATGLKVNRVTVNHYRTGRRPWSERFQGKVNRYLMLGSV
jgi:hypothetical protein